MQNNNLNQNVNPQNLNKSSMRVTKAVVLQALKNHFGTPNIEHVYFDDKSPLTKHCCIGYPEILVLPLTQWQFLDEDGKIIIVEYFRCSRCGKLLVYRDFM